MVESNLETTSAQDNEEEVKVLAIASHVSLPFVMFA
jgi:hypothetical protein